MTCPELITGKSFSWNIDYQKFNIGNVSKVNLSCHLY